MDFETSPALFAERRTIMIKLSDYVFQYVEMLGVKDVFMLSGGGCMHLVNSLGKNKNLNYRCCLFEQVVSLAADAYAQYSNQIGVGLVTTGPGGTNAITGVAAAWTDSIPLLMISGQVKTADLSRGTVRTKGFQELDIVSIVKPITKYAITIEEPNDIKKELDKAVYYSKEGRPGPVWIDIPLDIQTAMIDEDQLEGFVAPKTAKPDLSQELTEIVNRFNQSERPVILAGYGIKASGAEELFKKLIDKLGVPVMSTWKAMDLLPEEHPLFVGRPGCIGQRAANFAQQNSDFILTIGARLDFGQIGYASESFARKAFKVINDVDREELNKFKFHIDIPICADSKYFLEKLLDKIQAISPHGCENWLAQCKDWKERYPVILEEYYHYQDGASTYVLMQKLNQYTENDTVFAPGNSGAGSEIFSQAYQMKKGQRVVSMNTLGSMGTGLPESIGVCIANGCKNTICVNGDGGFQMNIQDLETVRRYELPIKYFVLNNKGYGSIVNTQDNYFEGFYVGANAQSGVTLPKFRNIAETYGLKYYEIRHNKDMDQVIPEIIKCQKPVLCEVHISPQEKTAPKQTSYIKKDGTMVSRPLEDLAPLLPRATLEREMLIPQIGESQ